MVQILCSSWPRHSEQSSLRSLRRCYPPGPASLLFALEVAVEVGERGVVQARGDDVRLPRLLRRRRVRDEVAHELALHRLRAARLRPRVLRVPAEEDGVLGPRRRREHGLALELPGGDEVGGLLVLALLVVRALVAAARAVRELVYLAGAPGEDVSVRRAGQVEGPAGRNRADGEVRERVLRDRARVFYVRLLHPCPGPFRAAPGPNASLGR